MKERIRYIDRLKGFAMLMVVLGHFLLYCLGKTGTLFEIIGSFHMPLFMFLSGLVLSRDYNFRETFSAVMRLLLPFLVVSLLYALAFADSYMSLLGSAYKFGYWYLYALAVFRVLLFVVRQFSTTFGRGRREKIVEVILLFAVLAIFQIVNSSVVQPYNDLLSLWLLRQYCVFFVLGYVFRRYQILESLIKYNAIYTVSLVGYVIAFYFYRSGYGHLFYLSAFLFVLLSCFIFVQREKLASKADDFLNYLGRNTLDIYLYHFFVIQLIHLPVVGLWLEETGNVFLELIIGVTLSVIVSFISIMIGKFIRKSTLLRALVYGKG